MALHRLDSVTRIVPDVAAASRFYRDFGLSEVAPGQFATVAGGTQLFLEPGDRPRVAAIHVGADGRSDLDDVASRCADRGYEVDGGRAAVRIHEPVMDLDIVVQVSPRLPREVPPATGGVPKRDELVPREPVRPVRLGHVVMGCPDVDRCERFFIDGLGMRLSDYVIGGPFMRFETDHHNIVLIPAPQTVLHHTAWKVRSVDEIGYGGAQMVRADPQRHAWGLGRHAASANYFWYLKDPAGSFAEYYYSEMDEVAPTPEFWDPVPDADELPVAVWSSPPVDMVLVPEAMTPPAIVDAN